MSVNMIEPEVNLDISIYECISNVHNKIQVNSIFVYFWIPCAVSLYWGRADGHLLQAIH